jgi:hypothetical protein
MSTIYYKNQKNEEGVFEKTRTDTCMTFSSASRWYIIKTYESFNGIQQDADQNPDQGNYPHWFAANAFGGSNYSNTAVGTMCNTAEPGIYSFTGVAEYFSLWASGRPLGMCAWNNISFPHTLVVGDPLVRR